jgi:hypothetical protein
MTATAALASHPAFTRKQTAAALALGTVALLIAGVQPALLGDLVAQGRISLEGVGLVAMGEIVMLGLGVLLGNAAFPLDRMRSIALAAALAAGAIDFAMARLDGDLAFALARAGAGLCEGILVWVTTCVIVRSPGPDRIAGIFFVVQTLAQAAVAALLAFAVMPAGGWPAGFALLAVLTWSACLIVPALRPALAPLAQGEATAKHGVPFSAAIALFVAFAQMAAIGALWAYLDPIARHAGLDAQEAQMLVALVLAVQVLGGSVAAAIVARTVPAAALLGALIVLVLLMLAIAGGFLAPVPFALACALFGFAWMFSMPFHVRLAFHADASGRLAAFVPSAQLLGVAFGPLFASLFIAGEESGPVPWIGAGFAVAAALALCIRTRAGPMTRGESQ